jgi:hypothetical protein
MAVRSKQISAWFVKLRSRIKYLITYIYNRRHIKQSGDIFNEDNMLVYIINYLT